MKQLLLSVLLLFSLAVSAQTTNSVSKWNGIRFENRENVMNASKCNASENYLKKKVKAQLATYYKDYPWISVDFTSFKGQHGYNDKETTGKIIYPFKIEMTVYLKRIITKEEKQYTEYTIYKYDSEYEYATTPKKKCEFRIVPSSGIKLVTKEEYEIKK